MRPRLAALLGLLAVVLLLAIQAWRRPMPASDATRVVSSEPAGPPVRALDFGDARSLVELEDVLERAYQPAPDRRMTIAFAQLSQLFAPARPAPAVRCTWKGDDWEIAVEGATAVALPALPRFADGLTSLEGWARRRLAAAPIPAGVPDGIATGLLGGTLPEQALAQLDEVAKRSGPTLALLEQALVACAQLSLVLHADRSSYADSTMARALALLALARAAGRGDHVREQCALAWAMGYTEEAAEIGRALPETDPLRSLVLYQDEALRAAARRPGASLETRLCELLARARGGDYSGWLDALEAMGDAGPRQTFTPLATALAFHRFDVARAVGPVLMYAAFRNVPGAPERPGADSTSFAAVEKLLARGEGVPHGVITGSAVSAARRALFYSGLLAWNEFVRDRLASPRVMERHSRRLGAEPGKRWSWYVRWHRHLSQAESGEDVAAALRVDLDDPEVPAVAALQTFDALKDQFETANSVAARAATRSLVARLDSRPRWAYELALCAQEHIQWPTLTERLLEHAVRSASREMPLATILFAQMRGDRAPLLRLADDRAAQPRVAMASVLSALRADSSAAGALIPVAAAIAARHPANWNVTEAYADLLEQRGRFAEAERVVLRWCKAADSTQDALDSTVAVTSLARLQRKQGRIEQALETMGDVDLGMQLGAMEEKARLLVLSGSVRAALRVAHACRERYPQVTGTLTFPVELYWLAERDEEAAEFVAKLPVQPYAIRGEVASSFARVFSGRREQGELALQALRAKVAYHVNLSQWIMWRLRDAGDVRFAAEIAENGHPGSGSERGLGLVSTYRLIAAARGIDDAREWISRQPMEGLTRMVVGGYLTVLGSAESAWAIERDLEPDEYNWVMRAAAWRMDGGRRQSWADSLRSHSPESTDPFYPMITRYLLGDVPEHEVLAFADTPKHQLEIWYHCALAAWSEGRSRDALLWMVLVMETGAERNGEYFWASTVLQDWSAAWRAPEKLGIGRRRA